MFENNHSDTEVIRKPAYAKATTDSVVPTGQISNKIVGFFERLYDQLSIQD